MSTGKTIGLLAAGAAIGFGIAKAVDCLLDRILVIEIGDIDEENPCEEECKDENESVEEDDESIFETEDNVTTAEA